MRLIKRVLALELSSKLGSIAWLGESNERFVRTFANDRKHSGWFFQNLQECLQRHGTPDMIVVGLGPGSYAGVRIAIATASGLRIATASQLGGIPSVCAIETREAEYWVIGDARRDSYFLGRVSRGKLAENFSLHSNEELMMRMKEIDGAVYASELLPQFPTAILAYPSAVRLAELGREQDGELQNGQPLEPIYLRPPFVTRPRKPVIAEGGS